MRFQARRKVQTGKHTPAEPIQFYEDNGDEYLYLDPHWDSEGEADLNLSVDGFGHVHSIDALQRRHEDDVYDFLEDLEVPFDEVLWDGHSDRALEEFCQRSDQEILGLFEPDSTFAKLYKEGRLPVYPENRC